MAALAGTGRVARLPAARPSAPLPRRAAAIRASSDASDAPVTKRLRPKQRKSRPNPRASRPARPKPGRMPDIDERLTMEAFYDTMDPQQREAFRQHVTEVVSQRFGEAVGSADPEEVHRMREVYGEQVDEPEFWMQIALNAAFWDILKEYLTRQEVALLEKALGPGWFLDGGLKTRRLQQAAMQAPQLTLREARQVERLLAKLQGLHDRLEDLGVLSDLADQAHSMLLQQAQEAQQQDAGSSSSAASSGEDADAERRHSNSQASSSSSSGSSSSSSSSSGGGGGGSSSSSGGSRPWESSSPPDPELAESITADDLLEEIRRRIGGPQGDLQQALGEPMASRIAMMTDSFLAAMRDSSRGSSTARFEEQYSSGDFRLLLQVHARARELVALEASPLGLERALQQAGSSAEQHVAAYEELGEQLDGLLQRAERVEDRAVVSALGYLSFCSAVLEAEAGPGQGQGEGVGLFQCTPEALDRLGRFLRAAEVVSAMQQFVGTYGEREPFTGLVCAWEGSGLATAEWWLTQAARSALVNEPDTFNFSPDSIDEQRIELLASLEPNSIRFLTDLELAARSGSAGSGGMDAALVKWYFHPTVGPKLTSGTWMSELPESLRKLQQVAGMQSGELDFDNMPWQDILGGSGA